MRRQLFFVICLLINLSISAQDIIKLKKGEELQVKVLKVTPSYIEYSYPNEDAVIQIQRKKVSSIQYGSGRVEEFEKPKAKEEPSETEVDVKKQTDKGRITKAQKDKVEMIKEPKGFYGPLAKKQMFYAKAGLSLNKIIFEGPLGRGMFKTGEVLDLGYSHYIKDSKFYWAAELGLTTRGVSRELFYADMDDMTFRGPFIVHHGLKFSPVNFGYRFVLPRDFAIDLRLGGYFAYYYAGKMFASYDFDEGASYYTWNAKIGDDSYSVEFNKQRRYNAGFETGIAFWYKRFCFDFTCNFGFVNFHRRCWPDPAQYAEMTYEDYEFLYENHPEKINWIVYDIVKSYNYNIQFKLGIAF